MLGAAIFEACFIYILYLLNRLHATCSHTFFFLVECLSADDCTHSNCPRLATVIGAILKTSFDSVG